MEQFKIGGEVECVDAAYYLRLTIGKGYIVTGVKDNGEKVRVINDHGDDCYYNSYRFKAKAQTMTQFKVLDTVTCIENAHLLTIGKDYIVVDTDNDEANTCVVDDSGDNRWYYPSRFKLKTQNMKLEITKEKVLEAAAKCSTAKETLKTLFPEVFEEEIKITWNGNNGEFQINGLPALYVESGTIGRKGLEFHLNSNFNWEIKEASAGKQLIPTRK